MTTTAPGRLLLMPNALDLGTEAVPLEDVLAAGVIAQAARLQHWVVEDARSARAFLQRVNRIAPLAQPLQALDIVELPRVQKGGARSAPGRGPAQAADLIGPARAGHDLGLLSEAGLPGVADPGAALVAAAHAAGLPVVALSGPSSLTLALAASGLNGQSFAFLGYLPAEAQARRTALRDIEATARRLAQTQVFIETPYRNAALFDTALECLQGSTRLAISCGLTLPTGWSRCRSIAQWKAERPVLPDRVPAVFCLLA
ncbi:MAG TPA: SAM-dependent methyltransferase [Burkholderiaceae bacterium]|nr:SAM-dependent methyltransferase [Burkholderiaceae bacterium]